MLEDLSIVLRLYGPLLLVGLGIVMLFRVKEEEGGAGRRWSFSLSIPGLPITTTVGMPVSLSRRSLRVFASAALLAAATIIFVCMDYSKLFRHYYKMTLHFDEHGLNAALEEFEPSDLLSIRFADGGAKYREGNQLQWFKEMSAIAHDTCGDMFANPGNITTKGHSIIVVEKTHHQGYHVAESEGFMEHHSKNDGRKCYSVFQLQPSEDDELKLSSSLTLRTHYVQLLSDSGPDQTPNQRDLSEILAITHVRVLPWPSVGRTVYLARSGGAGYSPVAYAVYQ